MSRRTLPLTLLVPLLTAFLWAVALPASAQDTRDWPTYGTSDVPELEGYGDFSVSYPAWFEAIGEVNVGGDDQNAQIKIAAGESRSGGHKFELVLLIVPVNQEFIQQLDGPESASVWNSVGEDFRSDPSTGTFSGMRPLVFKGNKAADFVNSALDAVDPEDGTPTYVVMASRLVVSGLHLYMAVCGASGISEDQARLEGFASREIPAVAEVCLPFLDSIEVK
ncbi:MAG: hypothetical protein LBT40_01600 [Deltaproteobacteria bacterium]|jgi:hypothetical protein|nr:hypothetical protein [Deltaproteobacteria bacterium]